MALHEHDLSEDGICEGCLKAEDQVMQKKARQDYEAAIHAWHQAHEAWQKAAQNYFFMTVNQRG